MIYYFSICQISIWPSFYSLLESAGYSHLHLPPPAPPNFFVFVGVFFCFLFFCLFVCFVFEANIPPKLRVPIWNIFPSATSNASTINTLIIKTNSSFPSVLLALPTTASGNNFTDQTWMIWRYPMYVRWNQYTLWSKISQRINNHSTKSGDKISNFFVWTTCLKCGWGMSEGKKSQEFPSYIYQIETLPSHRCEAMTSSFVWFLLNFLPRTVEDFTWSHGDYNTLAHLSSL